MSDPRTATTFLFVPGDRPERFDRAAGSGADVVIVDLEDGVAPAKRPAARANVLSLLRAGGSAVVRINACGTPDHAQDVRALRAVARYVMLSKTESAADISSAVAELGGDVQVIALIESARGVAEAGRIAMSDVVIRLAFGNVDLATELGVEADDRQALLTARSLVNLASATAGLHGPVDGVTTSFDDADMVLSDSMHAASLGFRAKMCIHPRQLSAARSGMAPTSTQVLWAQNILASASQGQARTVGGTMVDRPVEEKARDILRRTTNQH